MEHSETHEYRNETAKNSVIDESSYSVKPNFIRWFPPAIMLAVVASQYPYLLIYPFPGAPLCRRFFIVDPAVVASISLFYIAISSWIVSQGGVSNRTATLFTSALLVVLAVCAWQFFLIDNYTFREFAFNLVWFAVPAFVVLYWREFKRLLVPYMAFFWVFNAIYAAQDLWWGAEGIGLPGNRNWHGLVIVATTPFLLLSIHRMLSRKNVSMFTIALAFSLPTAFSLLMLYKCQSRGANLAMIATLLAAAFLLAREKQKLSDKAVRTLLKWGAMLSLPIAAAAIYFFSDSIAAIIMRDVRVPLWGGAVSLFADHPLIGVGSASYESHYVYHIPLAKFLRSWYYTERSDHPHNFFLYMLGSLGVVGFTAFLYLWIQPIITCVGKFRELDVQTKVTFFVFLAITLHSSVDIVMSIWPTIYFALILLGVLWGESFRLSPSTVSRRMDSRPPSAGFAAFSKELEGAAASVAISFAAFFIIQDVRGSSAERKAVLYYDNGNFAAAARAYNKAVESDCLPIYTYQAGMFSLLYLGDHRLALKYFERLQKMPANIIVHSNSHIAECLLHMGRKREALSRMREELRVYPVSIIALHNTLMLEKELGLEKDAQATAARLMKALKFKGLKLDDMKIVLRHPEYDGRFDLLKSAGGEKNSKRSK